MVSQSGENLQETRFVWDGSHLIREENENHAYSYIYTHPSSYEPLAQLHFAKNSENPTACTTYYYHSDQIGVPRELTDEQGKLCWYGDYTGWGKLKNKYVLVENIHQPFRLQNQYCDSETGLHYNFFRYYEPNVGRFTQLDPIGLAGGENLYRFEGNIQNQIDPIGLWVMFAPWTLGALEYTAAAMTGILIGVGISENTNNKNSNTISEEELRQQEYEIAKNFCDTPPPLGKNKCSTLSKQIYHAEQCIDLYEKLDEKWLKGRHDEEILNWKARLNNLKEESKRKCGHSTFS